MYRAGDANKKGFPIQMGKHMPWSTHCPVLHTGASSSSPTQLCCAVQDLVFHKEAMMPVSSQPRQQQPSRLQSPTKAAPPCGASGEVPVLVQLQPWAR